MRSWPLATLDGGSSTVSSNNCRVPPSDAFLPRQRYLPPSVQSTICRGVLSDTDFTGSSPPSFVTRRSKHFLTGSDTDTSIANSDESEGTRQQPDYVPRDTRLRRQYPLEVRDSRATKDCVRDTRKRNGTPDGCIQSTGTGAANAIASAAIYEAKAAQLRARELALRQREDNLNASVAQMRAAIDETCLL